MSNKILVLVVAILLGVGVCIHFGILEKPVSQIDELMGKDFNYARKKYFGSSPDHYYKINIKRPLNEFDGGVLSKEKELIDSIVGDYTWKSGNYQKTIWVGKTLKNDSLIIDALKYSRSVQF